MLFTRQVIYLEYLLSLAPFDTCCYYFGPDLSLVFLIKVLLKKKVCNVVFQSCENKQIILPDEFIFVFIWYFIGPILSKRCYQKLGSWKKDKKMGCP